MDQLGPYRLERRLDAGGRFAFFLAGRARDPYRDVTARCVVLATPLEVAREVWAPWADPALVRLLHHPGIVAMIDEGEADGQRYLVFEYVDGADLRALLARAPLSARAAVGVARALADALSVAHTARAPNGAPVEIVHGGVAPRWVLVSRAGDVRLAGFGIASIKPEPAPGSLDDADAVLARRVETCAPEQLRGEEVTTQTDVFQLGLVLHRMLVGAPFVSSPLARLYAAMGVSPRSMPEGRPHARADRALEALLESLLAERPADRCATMRAVRHALDYVMPPPSDDAVRRELATRVREL